MMPIVSPGATFAVMNSHHLISSSSGVGRSYSEHITIKAKSKSIAIDKVLKRHVNYKSKVIDISCSDNCVEFLGYDLKYVNLKRDTPIKPFVLKYIFRYKKYMAACENYRYQLKQYKKRILKHRLYKVTVFVVWVGRE